MRRIQGAETLSVVRTPRDCRHEPPYDGLTTVIFAISAPDMTCHLATPLCQREEPHAISECGEWTR